MRLKDEYRETCRIPLGIAIYDPPDKAVKKLRMLLEVEKPPLVAAVGDIVSTNLVVSNVIPNLAIVDGRTMRRPLSECGTPVFAGLQYKILRCRNPPGSLTPEAFEAVRESVKLAIRGERVLILVDGEEDLMAFPVLLYSTNRSLVVYGLWTGALVAVVKHPYLEKAVTNFLEKGFTRNTG